MVSYYSTQGDSSPTENVHLPLQRKKAQRAQLAVWCSSDSQNSTGTLCTKLRK